MAPLPRPTPPRRDAGSPLVTAVARAASAARRPERLGLLLQRLPSRAPRPPAAAPTASSLLCSPSTNRSDWRACSVRVLGRPLRRYQAFSGRIRPQPRGGAFHGQGCAGGRGGDPFRRLVEDRVGGGGPFRVSSGTMAVGMSGPAASRSSRAAAGEVGEGGDFFVRAKNRYVHSAVAGAVIWPNSQGKNRKKKGRTETSSWTVTPLVRDSFSMIGSAVGGTAGAFYAFNHAMPVVRRYVKGPMWIHFLVGAPPVVVFSSACAGLAGGTIPALAQLVSSSCHAAMSSPSFPRSASREDMHKSRGSSPL